MIQNHRNALSLSLEAAFQKAFGTDIPFPPASFETPPDRDKGDLATTLAFDLAKPLRKAPRLIAQAMVDELDLPEGIARAEVAGSGYLNFFFDRSRFFKDSFEQSLKPPPAEAKYKKIVVEHTNINPNKAAHIGHMRNAVLGDTLVRALRFRGENVEVQNFIDDTGVQVADVVVGFCELEKKSADEIETLENFDDVCWDLYARMRPFYAEDEDRIQLRKDALHSLESGEGAAAALGRVIARRVCEAHLALMEKFGIFYDVLVWESDILGMNFWEKAFERLKADGTIILEDKGKNKGCWVMPLSKSPEFKNLEDPDKILVRSNGTATYIAKDIAYQLWKFDLLGADFFWTPFRKDARGETLYRSSHDSSSEGSSQKYGGAEKVFNVIDVRQSYLQKIVTESLRLAGHKEAARNSIHFAYEMVALTPECARELGLKISPEDEDKAFIEMSGRKGMGVKASELLERLTSLSSKEVKTRNPDFSEEHITGTAGKIAVAALRYFMLRFTKNKVIAFDFDAALAFEGETGPYLQYTGVRVKNIFEKVKTELDISRDDVKAWLEANNLPDIENKAAWKMLYRMAQLEAAVDDALRANELSVIARFAFQLAQDFNSFYHSNPILHEKDEALRMQRLGLLWLFEKRYAEVLSLMGIELPERM